MALTLVLSVGLDAELLGARNLVLQSAGYTIVRAYSLKGAVDCFHTLDFDLVILCHSLPAKEKDRLISWIRASGSRVPVVSLSDEPCQESAFAEVTVGSDPDALLAGIRKALNDLAIPEARMEMSRDQQEAAAARKKPPGSSGSYEEQANQDRFVPFSRRSLSNSGLIFFPTHDEG